LQTLNHVGNLSIYTFPHRPPDIPFDDSDMILKSKELYKLSGNIYNAKYCVERFPLLKEKIIEEFRKDFGIDVL
jgi:hypothetical protein